MGVFRALGFTRFRVERVWALGLRVWGLGALGLMVAPKMVILGAEEGGGQYSRLRFGGLAHKNSQWFPET